MYQVMQSQELFVSIFKVCLKDQVVYACICQYGFSPMFNCGVFVMNSYIIIIISYRDIIVVRFEKSLILLGCEVFLGT